MAEDKAKNPHVLVFPFPIQGHIPPILKLAELLSLSGFHITFLNTETIHNRLLKNSPALEQLAQQPRFRFKTLPDGLTSNNTEPILQVVDLVDSIRARCSELYRETLVPKNGEDPDGWPPVTCVVADGLMPVAFDVAEEMMVPVILLRTSSPCSVWAYYSIPELIKRGELPFPEEADMDDPIQGVEGMQSLLRRRDLPGTLRHAKSPNDRVLGFFNTASNNLGRAKALILNTFEPLDSLVLSHIRSVCPIIYTIGPLHLLQRNLNSSTNFPSFWLQDRSCIEWLDSQPNKSVVYISFGSITTMTGYKFHEFFHGLVNSGHCSITTMTGYKFHEFFHGLVNSGHRFLWVIRPDLVQGITTELEIYTTERVCFVPWAPQEEVLAHPAIGCFLTHSGWNSTLESIAAGVPMICWPFFADQQITSRYVGEVWKIGVDMKDTCDRNTIESMARKVMVDEGLRKSVSEMANIARESVKENGSSNMNFQKLVQHIKSLRI
ncbi:LOW QUALITY PROTEIN: 7-deoxyloganetic acid glucosyltransferase-like [Asparagus officinalis]|uniref:LOW QUALITY PROTEIN: 7-deoxyloganetic acid glucosyltransferase-like n=1 Tax=Asparagus officinalis TaxID=4686 RepID=UPI00098DFFC8|nr:LOW QUALITY PROTEIN: 7-deoxyloganetic acid glucosyltransferase-like [Asparagus officinalis]